MRGGGRVGRIRGVETEGVGMRKIWLVALLLMAAVMAGGCATVYSEDVPRGANGVRHYDASDKVVLRHRAREAREAEKARKRAEKQEAKERAAAEKARKEAQKKRASGR